MDINELSTNELITLLYEGKIIPGHNPTRILADRAVVKGDYGLLKDYLVRNPIILRQAQQNIEMDQYRQLDNPFVLVSQDDAHQYLSGPIKLGYINKHNDMFGMHPDELSMPLIAPGRVGSGKSNFIKRLIVELLTSGTKANILIPDLKKEYRGLLRANLQIKVIGKKQLKFNPLKPEKWMGITEHCVFFAKVFTRQNYVLATSENILIDILEYLYRARGVYDGSQNWPTMTDLYRVITKRLESHKSFRFRDVFMLLQNRIYPYVLNSAFNCREGIPDKYWRTENMVLELDEGFTDNMYSFVVSYPAGLRYLYNKKHGLSGSRLRTLLVVDEGRILFDANRNVSDFGDSYINELSTKTRDYGVGYVIASQESSSFNQTIRANAYTKLAFPLTDGADRDFIKESFGLNQDQADYLFRLPKHGIAVARYGGYENPFLLGVPHVDLGSKVTDEDVEMHMAAFYGQLQREVRVPTTIIDKTQASTPPPAAMALIHYLSREPFTKFSDLIKAPGFTSQSEVKKAVTWLESQEFVNRIHCRVAKRGRKAVFTVLTQKALTKFGLKPIQGKGDFEHQLFQHLIWKKLRKEGLKARIEGRLEGSNKSMDVLCWDEYGKAVAYEVTLHLKNLIDNINQNFTAGISRVVVVCRDQIHLNKACEMVEGRSREIKNIDKVTFSLISDFFN